MVESKVSKNVLRFFYALDYKLDNELLRVGFGFHFQREHSETWVNKMLKLHATDEADTWNTIGPSVLPPHPPTLILKLLLQCRLFAPAFVETGVSTGVVATAAVSLISDGGGRTL
ncbi:hypothetical protein HHK36_010515 [Tetracentron sinense]|uniref:Uncharacterized protein n=1 Tax=Tetracentron sinense TaxID=13715 RepID=A0A834ZI64_TETSI|nr:hypothetical protein HHK36_010515 [Tetracentron sinense]